MSVLINPVVKSSHSIKVSFSTITRKEGNTRHMNWNGRNKTAALVHRWHNCSLENPKEPNKQNQVELKVSSYITK